MCSPDEGPVAKDEEVIERATLSGCLTGTITRSAALGLENGIAQGSGRNSMAGNSRDASGQQPTWQQKKKWAERKRWRVQPC